MTCFLSFLKSGIRAFGSKDERCQHFGDKNFKTSYLKKLYSKFENEVLELKFRSVLEEILMIFIINCKSLKHCVCKRLRQASVVYYEIYTT